MTIQKAIVFGGNGFVGSALVRALRMRGIDRVRSFDLQPHSDPAIESIVGDLRDPDLVMRACEGMDTVFQTASLVELGPRSQEKIFAVNVLGNRNVISACQKQVVSRLIYTSSADVVADGRPIRGGDEGIPYSDHPLDDYGRTKAIAEQDVLRANNLAGAGLLTCALRPVQIYGPGDRHLFPPVIHLARSGKMVYLGSGHSRIDRIYVENLVEAHLCAAQALQPGAPACGQAYFITDHPPENFFDAFTPYLRGLGYQVPAYRLPFFVAYGSALLLETLAGRGIGPQPPVLSRHAVLMTSQDYYFRSDKARRDIGYQPVVSREQAFTETLAWLRQAGYSKY
jgi:nucleoside-diphosphate-sugar epimerase